jgi:hypothetical protein
VQGKAAKFVCGRDGDMIKEKSPYVSCPAAHCLLRRQTTAVATEAD